MHFKIYGSENTEEIYANVYKLIEKTKSERPKYLTDEDFSRTSDWYKEEIIYMFYPDHFGVKDPSKCNTLRMTLKCWII